MITVIQHNKDEWSRLAQDAYKTGRNAYGHGFSAAAALPAGSSMTCAKYDALQRVYRAWLIGGWAGVEGAVTPCDEFTAMMKRQNMVNVGGGTWVSRSLEEAIAARKALKGGSLA